MSHLPNRRLWLLIQSLSLLLALPIGGAVAGESANAARQSAATEEVMAASRLYWADGYVWANDPTAASYTPSSSYSFNRTGGAIQITKPAGTTGRYLVKFTGLSAFLGAKSTVQVTGYFGDNTDCRPFGSGLVRDIVQVRCANASTGVAADTFFTLLVTRNYPDLAFAFANRPTATGYAPEADRSWNPGGRITVRRSDVGRYTVLFAKLGNLAGTNGGDVQVSAVHANGHCKVGGWGGAPDLSISVLCFNAAGADADVPFNVLFTLPSDHLAYAWADQPSTQSYTPSTFFSSNPVGGGITIDHLGTGRYQISWAGLDPDIFDGGDVQVTAYGGGNAQCKVEGWGSQSAVVRCFTPGTGVLVDTYFTVLLGS